MSSRWTNWLGVIIGVVGVVLAVFFYLGSRARREPVFAVERARTRIVDASEFPGSLSVLRKSGEPINGDVSSIRFHIWNEGKLPIRGASVEEGGDVLEPLTLQLSEETAEILDHRIVAVSRPEIVLAELVPDESLSHVLHVSYRILERDDGFTGEIIYVGDPRAELHLVGALVGSARIPLRTLEKPRPRTVVILALGVLSLSIALLALLWIQRIWGPSVMREHPTGETPRLPWLLNLVGALVGIALASWIGFSLGRGQRPPSFREFPSQRTESPESAALPLEIQAPADPTD